jgi:2-amino-4-hydroxy-6-hydroxymethyldihydropteridine diphosphokinase
MTSTSSITSVVIALGSNLGDRRYNLARAVHTIHTVVHIVRMSSVYETEPVDAPPPKFLNMAVLGYTSLSADALLEALLGIERQLGRRRRGVRNEPRVIDLDLILYGAHRQRSERLTLPHPRAASREFVMMPLREIWSAATPVAALFRATRVAAVGAAR